MDIQADFSCYITLNNKTDVDFELIDTLVISGKWPAGQPPNYVEANSDKQIVLNDPAGPSGSDGSVAYSFRLKNYPDTNITFRLNFADPYSSSWDNTLSGSTNHPELVSINIHPYSKTGHPFYGKQLGHWKCKAALTIPAEADIYSLKSLTSSEGEKAVAEIDEATRKDLDAAKTQSELM